MSDQKAKEKPDDTEDGDLSASDLKGDRPTTSHPGSDCEIEHDSVTENKRSKPNPTTKEDLHKSSDMTTAPEDEIQQVDKNRSNEHEAWGLVAPKAEFEDIDLDSNENTRKSNVTPLDSEGLDSVDGGFDDNDSPHIEKLTIANKDETDAASVFSLFMEKDFRYYFQHPYFRLVLAYLVTFCNFLIYAEDPVAHSIKESTIPVIGNDFAFVYTHYPPNAWSLLKVIFWLTGILSGMIIGKMIVHTLLFNKLLRLKMFHDDQGSWLVMFLCVVLTVFVMSHLYNAFLLIGGEYMEQFKVTALMGISNSWFMKAAACGTWCGDFFTAWMVTDMMLQEKLYPGWAVRVRQWWNRRYHRIILFWVVTLVTSFVVIFTISTDYISWDKLNHDFLPTNELSRSFLASFILVFDIMIVMQDWDFPHFISAIDIKLPGLNTARIEFDIPKCLKREVWHFHITGKWFNYGILFFVILLDMNMWKNQIFYTPVEYGQYTDTDSRIHTVLDQYSLDTYNSSLLAYDFRNSTINPATNKTFIAGDTVMNSRFYNYSLTLKGMAFIPNIGVFLLFGILIWMYGRFKPTKDDPYAGRLKKRRKGWRRFSDRFRWKNLRNRFRTAQPILTYFKRGVNRPVNDDGGVKRDNDVENQQPINSVNVE
ncbi:transmembrane protein 117-like [Gigantopelta aegis]|uniref:transmembrane protein 117-like n=1 Tax=Gigantopelta aegis TaxID=1735272 RepID=UPI001B88C195|nr:transmembrane protein 117-like [Gigantopelta aegis]